MGFRGCVIIASERFKAFLTSYSADLFTQFGSLRRNVHLVATRKILFKLNIILYIGPTYGLIEGETFVKAESCKYRYNNLLSA
jgi:hypothetical protein